MVVKEPSIGTNAAKKGRRNFVQVRLSDTEAEAFRSAARACGMNDSRYLREVILSNKTKVVLPDPMRLYHLNKAGNNLNQIARQLNSASSRGELGDADYARLLRQLAGLTEYFYLFASCAR